MPLDQTRSQSLVMDGFPSIVQRMATNRPLSDTSAAPNTGIPVCYCGALLNNGDAILKKMIILLQSSNRSFSESDIVSGRLYQVLLTGCECAFKLFSCCWEILPLIIIIQILISLVFFN